MTRKTVKIANKMVGDGYPCFVVGEIGINHNGSLDLAKKLILDAKHCGCDAVKFQKRTIELVYSKEELEKPRESVFGETNGDLKRGLEFSLEQYREIDRYCKELGIIWFASCWDLKSVDDMEELDVCAHKIPSALLVNKELLKKVKSTGKPVLLSCGMSSEKEIEEAIEILGLDNLILYHCTSTYPTDINEINLNYIPKLREKYPCPIGYSGHEKGIMPSVGAVIMGANSIERHITLDRTLWGSDQSASLEPYGLSKMIRDIRNVKAMMGDGVKHVYNSEIPIMKKLRRY